jgi:hypothetical protein
VAVKNRRAAVAASRIVSTDALLLAVSASLVADVTMARLWMGSGPE